MKIGILTFHRCINYGSFWQAKCLADGIKNLGHSVEILDHFSARVNRAEWKCALQPVLPTPVPRSDYQWYKQKIEKFFEAFCSLPLSKPFPLENPALMDEYDLVVVGSDEVWNLSHPWYGYYPVFYGEGIRARQLISYAASFGNYDVTWKPDQNWVNKLYHFNKISVRDRNSQMIIGNILGFEPETVLDPCLQFPINLETKKLPYIAVYGHNFSDSFIKRVVHYAGTRKLPLISIGYRNDWADEQWLSAGPHEFATCISKSSAVVTNFFHGCVFSLLSSKPFACETSSYRNHKIQDLLIRVNALANLITEDSENKQFNTAMSETLDSGISSQIEHLRNSSEAWLKSALVPDKVSHYESV